MRLSVIRGAAGTLCLLPSSLVSLAPLSLFILFVYNIETSGIGLQSSADLLNYASC